MRVYKRESLRRRSSVKHPKLFNPIEKHFSKASKFHFFIWTILLFSHWPLSWHLMSLIFISPPMEFSCGRGSDDCPCDEPEWNRTVFTETVQTKFSLHCNRTWLISFSDSMYYNGFLIGALLIGFLSDRYGRLPMYTLSCMILCIAGCIVSVMPTIESFILMRCLQGTGVGGVIVTSYVLIIEYCGLSHRETITAIYHIPVTLGHITTAMISYFLRHMDLYLLTISLPVLFCVLACFFIMESPKWLMDNNKIDKAAKIMSKICNFNGHPCDTIKEEMVEYRASHHKDTEVKKTYIWHLFKYRKMVINLACMSFNYFVCGMGYYGVSQFIGKMSGNIHFNVMISGTLLIPGTLASIYLLKVFNRRLLLMATNFSSGILMIITILIPESLVWCRVIFASLSNTFYFMSFIVVFLYGVELFPTSIRNSVLGFLSVLARLGQILGPPINQLPQSIAGGIFGVLAIIASALCFFLPETKDTELPSEISEAMGFSKKRRQLIEENENEENVNQESNNERNDNAENNNENNQNTNIENN